MIDHNHTEGKIKLNLHHLPQSLVQNSSTSGKMSPTTASWNGHTIPAVVCSESPTEPLTKAPWYIRTLVCKMPLKN